MAGSSCIWSAQLATSPSESVCSGASRRWTSASAAGLKCRCASSATTLWPSGPHASAGVTSRQASTAVVARRAKLMRVIPAREGSPQSATEHCGFLPPPARTTARGAGRHPVVNGKRIRLTQERDPANLKWNEVNAEVVIESTGLFLTKESAQKHID